MKLGYLAPSRQHLPSSRDGFNQKKVYLSESKKGRKVYDYIATKERSLTSTFITLVGIMEVSQSIRSYLDSITWVVPWRTVLCTMHRKPRLPNFQTTSILVSSSSHGFWPDKKTPVEPSWSISLNGTQSGHPFWSHFHPPPDKAVVGTSTGHEGLMDEMGEGSILFPFLSFVVLRFCMGYLGLPNGLVPRCGMLAQEF